MKELKDKVVVITGASSGIGRATALQFARSHAKLALAGRHSEALREAQRECEKEGAEAISVVCDVTKEDDVERLASRAQEAYGQIDVWVNNAAVYLFAKFDEAPSDDYRQVIETDFFGYVYGARSALKRFKSQGHGTLINVDSIEGLTPKPYNSAYAAAKHAVRALASSLRMELALDGLTEVNVCTVMPASVDTPLFAHAANYSGQTVQGSPRSTAASAVAEAITKLVAKPQREVIIGKSAKSSAFSYLFAPAQYERKTAIAFPRRHLGDHGAPSGHGNLYDPTDPHAISGGWLENEQQQNSTQLGKAAPWIALAGVVVGIGSLATWLFWPGDKPSAKMKKLMPKKST